MTGERIGGGMRWDEVFPRICDSMFRLTAKYNGGAVSATAFTIAKYKEPGNLAFVLATAEHVFKPLPMYTDVEWVLQRYNWKGEGTGWLTFKSNLQKLGKSPNRANLACDVGVVVVPKLDFQPQPELVPLINFEYAMPPGTKVGWSGFPGFVTEQTGEPRPCYFEGVISSVVDKVKQEGKL